MLDSSTLAQLKNLKTDIHNSIPRYTGEVRGTQGRYGFAVTPEGESFFLSPDEMDKVLVGDIIDFKVETAKNGKQQAIIEKLKDTQIKQLWGSYRIRGKGHFIEPHGGGFSRWIFIPPKARKKAKAGQLIRAELTQHPYPTGRAQADIVQIFGSPEEPQVEQRFMLDKHQIESEFAKPVSDQIAELSKVEINKEESERLDLTHLPFVTIDSATTKDIDDALLVEAQTKGWRLWIAIADPSEFIEPNSALDEVAKRRATSVYMPDLNIPMLPRELSESLCSLSEQDLRCALVVELQVTDEGLIESTLIHKALIKSHARLNYYQVAELITQGNCDGISPSLQGHIMHLDACSQALRGHREAQCVIMDEKRDYKLITGEDGKVVDICQLERNAAHRVVEECMLACNRAVASWLAKHNKGIYITNAGIRTERQGDMSSLLQEILELDAKPKFSKLSLQEYLELVHTAQNKTDKYDIKKMLSRQMDRSQLNLEPLAHSGLGFEHYTTFSSPLRKYNDLLVHRIVKSILANEGVLMPSQEELDEIQQQQNTARMASAQAEHWLKLDWLAKQPEENEYKAQIFQLMPHGLRVKLVDYGIDGYVDLNKNKKWQLDNVHMRLYNQEHSYNINEEISVKVKEVDINKQNLLFQIS